MSDKRLDRSRTPHCQQGWQWHPGLRDERLFLFCQDGEVEFSDITVPPP